VMGNIGRMKWQFILGQMSNVSVMNQKLLLIPLSFLLSFCGYHASEDSEDYEISKAFREDGTYCAEVTYYNSRTGKNSTYQLNVEIQDKMLVQIFWPNGGWLDEDHFSAVSINEDGYAEFTSDKNIDFTIQIIGSECGYTHEDEIERDVKKDKAKTICPECGQDKDRYDDLCDDCRRKKEDDEREKEEKKRQEESNQEENE
jgi:hypothetical protein